MTQKQIIQVDRSFQFWLTVIHDPRVGGRCKHRLIDVLVIAFCAILCGANSFVEMQDFGKAKEDWFRQYLELPFGVPSHDTFRRVLSIVDPRELESILSLWAATFLNTQSPRQVALDGKSLKGTERSFNQGKLPLHLVNVYSTQEGVVLGQKQAASSGSAEISAELECLKILDIQGTLLTCDAAGSYPKLLRAIREKKGHYLVPAKANQQELYRELERVFNSIPETGESKKVLDHIETQEKNRGRLEKRICSVCSSTQLQDERLHRWYPDLNSIIRVIRERQTPDKRYSIQKTGNDGKQSYQKNLNLAQPQIKREVTYYISDKRLKAASFLERIRSHWAIENKLHWSLDVAFGEDECRVKFKKAARNLSTLRKIAFNALRMESGSDDKTKKMGLGRKLKQAGWDNRYLEALLGQLQF